MTQMPFGKYKGTPVQDLLDEDMPYFIWLTTIELRGKLKEGVDKLKEEYKQDIQEYEYEDTILSGLNWYDQFD